MSLDYDMIIHQVQLGIPFSESSGNKIVKFADSLKDIVCILTGCTREQLESQEFKNSNLPKEWKNVEHNDIKTYRKLLQHLGTDLLRNQLHENVWVNALFSKYKRPIYQRVKSYAEEPDSSKAYSSVEGSFPSWIITDCRFPNEAKAIKDRGGIIIRVNRDLTLGEEDYGYTKASVNQAEKDGIIKPQHMSETALDNYAFDWIINNNDSIEDLIVKTKEMLHTLKLI